jgi:DNA-3-methyladenine glycosylase II
VDAISSTSPEAHRAGLDRVMQAGGQPVSWVSLTVELQRDWARQDTRPGGHRDRPHRPLAEAAMAPSGREAVVNLMSDAHDCRQRLGPAAVADPGRDRPGAADGGAGPDGDERRAAVGAASAGFSTVDRQWVVTAHTPASGSLLPAPAELLAADPGQLRAAGLSWRKVGTLRDLAGRLTDGRLNQDALSKLPDDELIAELTTIPGIGPWTARGALLIALGREDVVLPGDLTLRKAVRAAYRLDHLRDPQEVLAAGLTAPKSLLFATGSTTPTRPTTLPR